MLASRLVTYRRPPQGPKNLERLRTPALGHSFGWDLVCCLCHAETWPAKTPCPKARPPGPREPDPTLPPKLALTRAQGVKQSREMSNTPRLILVSCALLFAPALASANCTYVQGQYVCHPDERKPPVQIQPPLRVEPSWTPRRADPPAPPPIYVPRHQRRGPAAD